ncbi:MAG: ArnT family glycosyltransferase [Acidimicrobiales bacterium]
MTIARRIWDSPNPGLSQLGTNWLPLPHLLFLFPSIWLWAWHTGIGGSVVSSGCAVVTSVSLYRIGQRTGVGNLGGWVAAMIVTTNPSWVYLSAVPMTEPFTVAAICVATAGLLRWAMTERTYSFGMTALFCGLPTAAAVLTRYEGWGFFGLASMMVLWVSWRRFGWGAQLRHQFLAFVMLPTLAILWWFIFNWSVYGDPLAFEHGKYSSKALVAPMGALGLTYGRGNLLAAFTLYGKNVLDLAGSAVLVAALIGLGVTVLRWRGLRQELWLCLSATGIFVVAAVWQGQVYIRLPGMIPSGIFNTRFGVESLPLLAIAASQILRVPNGGLRPGAHVIRIQSVIAILMIGILSGGWVLGVLHGSIPGNSLTVLEAKADQRAGSNQRLAAQWLHTNATSGYILLDDTVLPVLPIIGFDFHRVIFTSSGSTFRNLLSHPRKVTWVVVQINDRSDIVWRRMKREGVLGTVFLPVAAFGNFVIFKQESSPLSSSRQLIPMPVSGLSK